MTMVSGSSPQTTPKCLSLDSLQSRVERVDRSDVVPAKTTK